MPVSFRRESKTVEVLAADSTIVRYELEYRWDPLTSRVAVICPHLREKWTEYYSVRDEEWLRSLVEASQAGCPFCHPTIDKVAARFAPNQLDEDQIRVDEVVAFPNLYPRTDFEAVVTSPGVHYLRLNEFTPTILAKFLTAALDCIKQAYRKNDKLHYPVIGGNYLPPAGASLVHYHMQLSMQEYPFESVRTLIDATTRYEQKEHANFWLDLMAVNEAREIARTNNVYWYTPFAPTGFCEVRALITKPTFMSVSAQEVQELAEGLAAVLNYYNDHGFAAFNFMLYSDRLDAESSKHSKSIPPGLQIVARPNPRPNYLSIDSWYMPLLLQQAIVLERPEELARDLKPYVTAARFGGEQ
jgi:galactose-1-phosphate uridylyltransferase